MSQDSPAPSPFSPPFFTARLTPSGLQVDAWADQPLLHSLEQGGVDWPSSCRNGTCRTCICHMPEGKVRYTVDWPGISPDERLDGDILPCVAVAESDLTLQARAVRTGA